MIRVLQVIESMDRGGAETMIMNLYRHIDRKKVQFDFIVHSKNKQEYLNEIRRLGGKIYYFEPYRVINCTSYKKQWIHFFKTHPEYKILHSHLRSYASIYLPIAKKYEVKTIIHSHNISDGNGYKAAIKRYLQRNLCDKADYLFACSTEAGIWLYGKEHINGSNYYMLKNAIDVDEYIYSKKKRDFIRNEFNISNSANVIGTVGRLTEQKNPNRIIEIMRELVKLDKKILLLWVGTGKLCSYVQKKIDETKLNDNIILCGVRNDIASIMSAIDVFLLPSLWEGLPVVAVEAQASGLPCILSDTVTKEVQISDLVTYVSLDKNNDEWAKCIVEMIGKRHDVSKTIVESGFDIRNTSSWLCSFYSNLVGE